MTEFDCHICGNPMDAVKSAPGNLPLARCGFCALESLQPFPAPQSYDESYFRAWGLPRNESSIRRMKMRTFLPRLAALSLSPGARVLDCGAATGFLMEAASELGMDIYGLELSAFGCEQISRRFGPDRVYRADWESFEPPAAGFEAILMYDFLEHLKDPRAALRKACATLRPGGKLSICTPDTSSLSRALMGRVWPHYKAEHLYYFNRENLCRLLSEVGFEVTSARPARKSLSPEYIASYFSVYRAPLLSSLMSSAEKYLPEKVMRACLTCSFGEVLVDAHKKEPAA